MYIFLLNKVREAIGYASLLFVKTYKCIMNNVDNEYWFNGRPYYFLYQDKTFLKDIFSQICSDFTDFGEIAYIGASTHKTSKDYSLDRRTIKCFRTQKRF